MVCIIYVGWLSRDLMDIMGGCNFLSPSHPLMPEFLTIPFSLCRPTLSSTLLSLDRNTKKERMAVDLLPAQVTVSKFCLFNELPSVFRDGGHISILCPGTLLSSENY